MPILLIIGLVFSALGVILWGIGDTPSAKSAGRVLLAIGVLLVVVWLVLAYGDDWGADARIHPVSG